MKKISGSKFWQSGNASYTFSFNETSRQTEDFKKIYQNNNNRWPVTRTAVFQLYLFYITKHMPYSNLLLKNEYKFSYLFILNTKTNENQSINEIYSSKKS